MHHLVLLINVMILGCRFLSFVLARDVAGGRKAVPKRAEHLGESDRAHLRVSALTAILDFLQVEDEARHEDRGDSANRQHRREKVQRRPPLHGDHHRREADTHGSVKLVTKLADSRESKLI